MLPVEGTDRLNQILLAVKSFLFGPLDDSKLIERISSCCNDYILLNESNALRLEKCSVVDWLCYVVAVSE